MRKWLLATSDIGNEIQEDVNAIVGQDENFNNAVIRRVLDLKNAGVFENPNPFTVVFRDVKKFDVQNPLIGKLATQIKASKLTEEQLTNNILLKDQISDIKDCLAELKRPIRFKKDGNDDDSNDDSGIGPSPPPSGGQRKRKAIAVTDSAFRPISSPRKDKDEFKKLMERLDKLCGRDPSVAAPDDKDDIDFALKQRLDTLMFNPLNPEPETTEKVPKAPIPKPIIDTFSRPLTKMLDNKTIEITPKQTPPISEQNLSEQVQQLFPDVDKLEREKSKKFNIEVENLSKILSEIGETALVPFEFEFFNGGENETFAENIRSLAPSTENLAFLDFLMSDISQNILTDNKLKIHSETGNIYHNDQDTNESIFDFILKQQNPYTGYINHNFVFDRYYVTYFDWLLNGFTAYEKNKLDVFANKNSKFLFYHFNDYLKEARLELKQIKHPTVTQDYIAAEEIQNRNWQYFVESVLKISEKEKNKQPIKRFQLETLENVTIAKKTYENFYNSVDKSLFLTLNKLPFEDKEKINDDFVRENFDLNDLQTLDSWVAFYYKHGRFPGSQTLIILPQVEIPEFVKTSTPISPLELYKKFNANETKGVVSVQALAVLHLHLGGERIFSKKAMSEWQQNLTFQALTKENDNIIMSFQHIGQLIYNIHSILSHLEKKLVYEPTLSSENLNIKLDETQYSVDETPEMQMQMEVDRYRKTDIELPPIYPFEKTPPPLSENERDDYLKTALTLSKTNLDASIDVAEKENEQVIRDITDPTPGLLINDSFNITDLSRNQNESETDFKLVNSVEAVLDNLLQNVSSTTQTDQSVVEYLPNNANLESTRTEDIYTEDSYINPLAEISSIFPPQPTDTRKDFNVTFSDNDLQIYKSAANEDVIREDKIDKEYDNLNDPIVYRYSKQRVSKEVLII